MCPKRTEIRTLLKMKTNSIFLNPIMPRSILTKQQKNGVRKFRTPFFFVRSAANASPTSSGPLRHAFFFCILHTAVFGLSAHRKRRRVQFYPCNNSAEDRDIFILLRQDLIDDAAAEAFFAVIQNGILPERERALRLLCKDAHVIPFHRRDDVLFRLTVTEFCRTDKFLFLGRRGDPVELCRHASARIQALFAAVRDIENVIAQVLFDDKPASALFVPFLSADIEPLSLSDRVVHEPDVFAEHPAVRRHHFTGLCGKIIFQKIAEVPLPDKTDARAVFFLGRGKTVFFGNGTHLSLSHFSEREKHVIQLVLPHLVEKIRLIFIVVCGFEKIMFSALVQDVAIVPRSDKISPERFRLPLEGPELDLAVAKNVGIGRPAALVFFEKIGKDALFVFLSKIHGKIRDADLVGNALDVLKIRFRRATAVFSLFFPVDHIQPDDVVPLFFEQKCRYGTVHAAAHADDDRLFRVQICTPHFGFILL